MSPLRFATAALLALGPPTSAVAQAASAPPSAPAPAVDPARLALARDIVAVVLPPAQRQQIMTSFLAAMLRNMIAGMVDGLPGLKAELATKPAVKTVFDRFIARQQSLGEADIARELPGLVDAYANAYARTFTADELAQIKAFVSTPVGTKFMQRGSALMSDPDVAEWQRHVTEIGASRQRDELAAFERDLKAARGEPGT